MENERIKTLINGWINLEIKHAKNPFYIEELKELQNEFNQPEEPQGYQGLNKWYLIKTGASIRVTSQSNLKVNGYGVNYDAKWVTEKDGFSCSIQQIERELTPEEIKVVILKGCEQKGIVKGAKVKPFNYLVDNLETLTEESYITNSWCVKNSDGYYVRVFDNGKFAEVVKGEKPITKVVHSQEASRMINELVSTTDKELLKECGELLKEVLDEDSCYPSTDRKIQELVIKLNKHLNHE